MKTYKQMTRENGSFHEWDSIGGKTVRTTVHWLKGTLMNPTAIRVFNEMEAKGITKMWSSLGQTIYTITEV